MTTRYHVTSSKYDGSDLLSIDEAINRGADEEEMRGTWKWEHDFDGAVERQFVSLFATLEDAQEFVTYAEIENYSLLAVETDGLGEFIWSEDVTEHPAVMGFIPAGNITIIK